MLTDWLPVCLILLLFDRPLSPLPFARLLQEARRTFSEMMWPSLLVISSFSQDQAMWWSNVFLFGFDSALISNVIPLSVTFFEHLANEFVLISSVEDSSLELLVGFECDADICGENEAPIVFDLISEEVL